VNATAHEGRFPVWVEGREVWARPGQTVAAVLMEAGMRSWRTTRVAGRPRGLFCGIGICFDCLVTLNGRPSVRACLVEIAPGDVVRTQEGHGHDRP
jgi:aerobic-type carbon monoxide dehydrogenase small subunit (CoxS/CutS family)